MYGIERDWIPSQKSPAEPVKTRPSNEEIQAAMSLLAVQPLLPGKVFEARRLFAS
jgi:hypothetical protein